MRNYRAIIEYDGTRYRGWQIQRNARTVGGDFAEALSGVLKESPRVFAAGRTDAGVHAIGQVVSFRSRTALAPRDLREQLNDRLPADINVLDLAPAPFDFHARHAAVSRAYRYQVALRRTAFAKRYVWWVRSAMDAAILREAAARIREARDFRSFAEGGADDGEEEAGAPRSTRCRILEADWREEDYLLVFRIRADRFLWKMVRRLVGTMVAESLGQVPRGSTARWLAEPSAEPARLTAPPSGLFLESVEYPAAGDALPHEGPVADGAGRRPPEARAGGPGRPPGRQRGPARGEAGRRARGPKRG